MAYLLFSAMFVVLVIAAVKSDQKARTALDSYNYLSHDKYSNQALFFGAMAVLVVLVMAYYHYTTLQSI